MSGPRSLTPGPFLFFGLGALGILMVSIDSTVVAVAIPSLTSSLDTSLSWVGWTLTANQLVQVVVMPLAGRLSDTLGRKRVFMFSIGCFTIGSLLSGLASNIALLIVFRVIQGVGGGGVVPSAVGIVSDRFKEKRSQAIGLFSSIFPIGAILGPNIGGWIVEHWSWRGVFFVNLPIGLAILVGAQLLLRDKGRLGTRPRVDAIGLGLFVGALVSVMYGMTWAGTAPGAWQTPVFWLLIAGGIALFILLAIHERRADEPVLDLELVAKWPFLPTNVYNFIFGACAFGFFSFIPYYAVVQYGMGPAQSGAVLTPRGLASIVVSVVASLFLIRLGYRIPMIGGMIAMSLSLVLLSFGWDRVFIGPLELDGFWWAALAVAISGVGVGLAGPASNNASIDLMPSKAAAITGLRGMFRVTGGIMGISSIVLVLSLSGDQAAALRDVFFVLGLLLLTAIPLVMMIPDSAQAYRSRAPATEDSAQRRAGGK